MPAEVFAVRLDKLVGKWSGSIEIGVTLHKPQSIVMPSTMTNVQSGTWMMSGNGVMHNGVTVMDDCGQSLDRLVVRCVHVTHKMFLAMVDQIAGDCIYASCQCPC